ncbi:putative RNA polymerase II subunit B1 CTD phosphatase RPAP2 [Armigeres subalbatus]|uniref:putative RNA polymerase II subunit B1 CTD phosphatase RPAP2 n=1 Tax=Armigeres subalbatus TaxID=124917 RepID=UPI002ED38209
MFDNESFNVFRDGEAVKEKQKVNRTKLPRKAKNFSKEQLQLALRKKKECNAKAQTIVEALLDPVDDVETFLTMLRDINQSHFEDVIQERAIQKVCGYPLCAKELLNIPQQKYVISLSNKKVYDITERKNFCSGDCYKASNFIKEQMLTSPLWLRNQEDIPVFRLLNNSSQITSLSTNTMVTVEVPKEPMIQINIDELRIVEKTYPSATNNVQNDDGRQTINEGSEVDLAIKQRHTIVNQNESKDLIGCLDKLSLNDSSENLN